MKVIKYVVESDIVTSLDIVMAQSRIGKWGSETAHYSERPGHWSITKLSIYLGYFKNRVCREFVYS